MSDHRPNTTLRRFIINTIVVWSVLGVYMLINHHQPANPFVVPMPAWVPFWPAFIVPYFGMLLLTWFLPAAIRDAARFRACERALICAFLLIIPWWLITPTMLPRPPLPEGAWTWSIKLTWMLDAPTNITPCGHGIGPVVAAWYVVRDRPNWRWPLIAILTIGLSSIALTWQHRPVDILLGTIAAAIGIAVAEMLRRRNAKSDSVNASFANASDNWTE